MTVSSILQYVLVAIYAALWAVPFAAAALLIALQLSSVAIQYGFHDDWLLLLLPFGAVIGFLFGIRSRTWTALHWICIPLGLLAAAWLYWGSLRLAAAAEAATGGNIAGLGDAIGSVIALALAVAALLVSVSGIVGIILRWRAHRLPSRSIAHA